MSLLDFIIMFIIAAIVGSIARSLVGFDRGGCILSAVVGFIGALIGTWLAREFDWPKILPIEVRGITYPIVWTLIGAVIFVLVLSLISPRKKQ